MQDDASFRGVCDVESPPRIIPEGDSTITCLLGRAMTRHEQSLHDHYRNATTRLPRLDGVLQHAQPFDFATNVVAGVEAQLLGMAHACGCAGADDVAGV